MFQSWILDLIIKDGKIDSNQPHLNGGLWLIISADGIPRPFATTETPFSLNPTWNFPARLILQLNDLCRSYLYVTLCTKGINGNVICLARSRIGLRSLPIGTPKTFQFPLMQSGNAAQPVMTIRITSTLSSLSPNNTMKKN